MRRIVRWTRWALSMLAMSSLGCASAAATAPPPATEVASATTDPDAPAPVHHHHRRHDAGAGDEADPASSATQNETGSTTATATATAAAGDSPSATAANPGLAMPAATAVATADGPAPQFGTPTVGGVRTTGAFEPHWIAEGSAGHLVCVGAESLVAPRCPQCPDTPSNAAIVRAFVPIERRMLHCQPPANAEGRLPIRATFNAAGALVQARFPGIAIAPELGQCLGRALCDARVPSIRSPAADVDYEIVVLLPDRTGGP